MNGQLSLNDMLSTSDAARVLGLSAMRVRQLVSEGKLRSTPTPLGNLFAVTDVQRLADERKAGKEMER